MKANWAERSLNSQISLPLGEIAEWKTSTFFTAQSSMSDRKTTKNSSCYEIGECMGTEISPTSTAKYSKATSVTMLKIFPLFRLPS